MELKLAREDAAFRDEVKTFIAENYPKDMRVPNPQTDLTKEQSMLWNKILHKKGWIAPLWPKEYGGPGWSITQRFIWERETTLAQHADWIFCLVRTDPPAKAQAAISFLLIDMKSPGVTARPIVTIDGSHVGWGIRQRHHER